VFSVISLAIPQLEAFHRANGLEVDYLAGANAEHSRSGVLVSANKHPEPRRMVVLINWTPTLEQVTVFGDPSKFSAGRRAVFRVLASDACPDQKGSFLKNGKTYNILAINPLERGGQTYCFDCLVGYE
jgi:hypothetical protein